MKHFGQSADTVGRVRPVGAQSMDHVTLTADGCRAPSRGPIATAPAAPVVSTPPPRSAPFADPTPAATPADTTDRDPVTRTSPTDRDSIAPIPTPSAPSPTRDAAFAGLFRAQYPRIQAYLHRRTGNPEEARDLAAEVFRLAWERSTGPNPPAPIPPTPGWLFVTARNVLANHLRKAATGERLRVAIVGEMARQPLRGAVPGPESPGHDPSDRVLAILATLPEPQAELLMAHYWDALSGAECAALLGCSIPAVWMRLSRARAAFRLAYTTVEDFL
ncbi:MAG: sigma-70 family RNA polymerase sigma factor [Bifidobacteriaceae bacterium]|jgi:RNA polymerase sigma-70 factor (ECF subfamily)|nr:sigma-70 family RNA polymerase sigma factor [Bifidobacteriaceae bacterium]